MASVLSRFEALQPRLARPPAPSLPTSLDHRFRRLLGDAAWDALSPAVRARFGRKALAAQTISYVGEVVECRMSALGWLLAQACRVVGAPLPLGTDTRVPAVVSVTEDMAGDGQFWTRSYGRQRGFPQVIHSSKRFAGPTGIEEYLGLGFGIALAVSVEGEALLFDSDHYFWRGGGVRMRLPRWLAPGRLRIAHVDLDRGWFAFTLALDHRFAGPLIRQCCIFTEYRAGDPS